MCTDKWRAYRMTDKEKKEDCSIMLTKSNMPIGDIPMGEVHDGYHTFDELYHHRMMLFAVICNTYKEISWKSWEHHPEETPMYKDYFIVGIITPEGDYTYHYHKDHWDMFKVKELEHGPKWDGHKPSDITRLLTIL